LAKVKAINAEIIGAMPQPYCLDPSSFPYERFVLSTFPVGDDRSGASLGL
jgi:hypothetical protein